MKKRETLCLLLMFACFYLRFCSMEICQLQGNMDLKRIQIWLIPTLGYGFHPSPFRSCFLLSY